MSDVKKTVTAGKRGSAETAKLAPAGRTTKAVKNGPHGAIKNADGSTHATPNSHGPTSGTR